MSLPLSGVAGEWERGPEWATEGQGESMARKRTKEPLMTRAQARAWKLRWLWANQQDFEEARARTFEQKVEDLSSLLAFARSFPLSRYAQAEEQIVRARWLALKRAYHAGRLAP